MRGHVRKRGRTWTYVVDVGRDAKGKRRQKWVGGFESKREAQSALTDALSALGRGTFVEPSQESVAEFLRQWLSTVESQLRPSTFASYSATIENHIVPRIGGIRLRDLGPGQLTNLYGDLHRDGSLRGPGGLSSRTVRYVHRIVHRALQDAVRWGHLFRNPVGLADPPRVEKSESAVWSAAEARLFIDSTRQDRLRALYLLALTTGMRRGELLGLRWSDVDFERCRLSAKQTLVSVGYEVRVSEPKTKRARRSIALDGATVAILRSHRAEQSVERLRFGEGAEDNDLVFTREDGSLLHPMSVSARFKRLVRSAGLSPIRFHGLRHTSATLALEAGLHPKVVSERLGHSSITVTLDTYSHAVPALQEEAAEALAALLS